MSKPKREYRCECGHTQARFFGICPSCGEGGSAVEQTAAADGAPRAARKLVTGPSGAQFGTLKAVSSDSHVRQTSGIAELDRVLGGGIVPGSYMVLSAAPGQGKSTLASQLLGAMSAAGRKVALVAAEESPQQVKLRFERLGMSGDRVLVTSTTDVQGVIDGVSAAGIELVVIDSIQTVHAPDVSGAPGSIGQVRECGQLLMRLAKECGVAVLLIGQVTKDGSLAGPRTLEHMVDVVMELEGDRDQQLRILRAVKNRFGSTDEIGVFEMTGAGLIGVEDPSQILATRRSSPAAGAVICPVIEGSRPVLVEVQALVAPTNLPQPIRACSGVDPKRFQLLCAVLSRRAQLRLGTYDVFLQIAGGLKVHDTGLDLACCIAVASAYHDSPLPQSVACFGEVSLLGEIRPVPQSERRNQEAQRLGLNRVLSSKTHETLRDVLSETVAA